MPIESRDAKWELGAFSRDKLFIFVHRKASQLDCSISIKYSPNYFELGKSTFCICTSYGKIAMPINDYWIESKLTMENSDIFDLIDSCCVIFTSSHSFGLRFYLRFLPHIFRKFRESYSIESFQIFSIFRDFANRLLASFADLCVNDHRLFLKASFFQPPMEAISASLKRLSQQIDTTNTIAKTVHQ